MGLFSRNKAANSYLQFPALPSALSYGTWTWSGEQQEWSLSFSNRLASMLRMSLTQLVYQIKELDWDQKFSTEPVDGERIRIRGMQGFGDDYRWYAYIHGLDGRHYFFEKFDRAWASQAGTNFYLREALEIDSIPFESDDELPDAPTHRLDALVSESDEGGMSEAPTVSLADSAWLAEFSDFTNISYDDLCFYLFGGVRPWQEKVIGELKRRHESGILDSDALTKAVKLYQDEVKKQQDNQVRALANQIEAELRRVQGHGFDPPGGWGAVGPG
jgi:hypothetical protein